MKPDETSIVNALRSWLSTNGYQLIQLIAPGGQATYSVSYTSSLGDRKLCYPDLICIKEGAIIVGEVKPLFSKSDYEKLTSMSDSDDFHMKVASIVGRLVDGFTFQDVQFWMIFSGPGKEIPRTTIKQMSLSETNFIELF